MSQNTNEELKLVSLESLAKILHYKDEQFRQLKHWVRQGKLPEPKKVDSLTMYFDEEDLRKFFIETLGTEITGEPFITSKEVGEILAIPESSVNYLCKNECIPYYELRFGKKPVRILYRASEVISCYKVYLTWNGGALINTSKWESYERIVNILLNTTEIKSMFSDNRDWEILHAMLKNGDLKEAREAVGEDFNLSAERVRQIFHKELRRLRWILPSALDKLSEIKNLERSKRGLEEHVLSLEEYIKKLESMLKPLNPEIKAPTMLEVSEEELKLKELFDTKLVDCDLSIRALNCLKAGDIVTIGELINFTEKDLLRFRAFGNKSVTEIKEFLYSKGLKLRD